MVNTTLGVFYPKNHPLKNEKGKKKFMSIQEGLFRLSCPLMFLTLSHAAMGVNVASSLLTSPADTRQEA